jgi:hypothetical protein
MNWMSDKTSPSEVERWLKHPGSDLCEHVAAKTAPPYIVRCEDDSFGPVCRNVICRVCYEADQEQEDNEEVVCQDCHKRVAKKDSREWRWYDFYAAQGDEPLVICNTCWHEPAHKARRAEDQKASQEESEYHRTGRWPSDEVVEDW